MPAMKTSKRKEIARIKALLPEMMISDRRAVLRALARLEKGKADAAGLAKLHRSARASAARRRLRHQNRPCPSPNPDLPITKVRQEIISALAEHRVIIVAGRTGSGKTTQIPQYCLEAGLGVKGMIGCTQPRRIAAITVAQRIARELGQRCGEAVGYKVRFSRALGKETYIKIMTDGTLLAEVQQDRWLNRYDTIIVDEAHERSLNIDFVLGILRRLVDKRKDLKLVITSATIDTEKFSRAFQQAPIIEIPGRLYPVKTVYRPPETFRTDGEITHIEMAVEAMAELQRQSPGGHVLIFMPTEQDIRDTCALLASRKWPGTMVLPLFARLTPADQKKVFLPSPGRKIIVATNVAETSLTIPGIRYVIDTGLARISHYSHRTRTTTLPVTPISRSSADQRQGRCGRTADGVCIRLFSEQDYLARPRFTKPEILRANLAEVILRMLSLGLGRIDAFPFIDQPNPGSIQDGFRLLVELGAIEVAPASRAGYRLTSRGRMMARLPLDPRLSRILLEAGRRGCLEQVKIIAAALSIQDPRLRPADNQAEADRAHARFADSDSDFNCLLNIWNSYHRVVANRTGWRQVKLFCRKNFLSFRRMREWRDIHFQIGSILEEHGIAAPSRPAEKDGPRFDARYQAIHKSILSGFLANIATRTDGHVYQAAGGRQVMIFPGSGLFSGAGNWIVAAEMVATTRLFARQVANIDPAWIEPLAKKLCRYTCLDPHWERKQGSVMATKQVSLFGLIIDRRKVRYGPIDPEAAGRIFIRSCLIEGDLTRPLPFMAHNQKLLKKVSRMEDKLRRRDLMVGRDELEEFYRQRLPGIYDLRQLKSLIRRRGGDDFLCLEPDQVWRLRPEAATVKRFPDAIDTGGRRLRCSYRFDPAAQDDGVTVYVPASEADRVSACRLQWLVPGLLREKITALLKSLPKAYRKQLVPLSETAALICEQLEPADEPLAAALSRFIASRFGLRIPAAAFDTNGLEKHLRMRIAITDKQGRVVKAGRDPAILHNHGLEEKCANSAFGRACRSFRQGPFRRWQFADLPETVTLAGRPAFVGLEDTPQGVYLAAFADRDKARAAHLRAVQALLARELAADLKQLRKNIWLPDRVRPAAAWLGGAGALEEKIHSQIVAEHLKADLRTRAGFENHVKKLKSIPLPALAFEKVKLVTAVLEKYLDCRRRIESVPAGGPLEAFRSEVTGHLEQLVPPNFVSLYGDERLARLPAYLEAIAVRIRRALLDPEKDRNKKRQVEEFSRLLQQQAASLGRESSQAKRKGVEEFYWLLEEFKISVFAQEIKTAGPVSVKRLRRKLQELEQMV